MRRPVYHGIKYLTGELDRAYLTTLRQRGGLQAYPSRTKDPDVSDFSTGSVGLGAVAPLFSALTRRYVASHFGDQPEARFIALVGDAELDEGNIWEAIADPATKGLGNFTMVVDLNRQSLDRVIPEIAAVRLKRFFADAGWHVAEAKYGSRLTAAFARPGGDALGAHIDAMANEAYQALFAMTGHRLRDKFLRGADPAVARFVADLDDDELKTLVTDLGGHDIGLLLETFAECDRQPDRPSVVFAYTIKGWGLPIAGDPLNHAALLSPTRSTLPGRGRSRRVERVGPLRRRLGAGSDLCCGRRVDQQSPAEAAVDPSGSAGRGRRWSAARRRHRRHSGGCSPAWPMSRVSANASSPPPPTCRSRQTSAAGSTRTGCTPPLPSTTTAAPTGS